MAEQKKTTTKKQAPKASTPKKEVKKVTKTNEKVVAKKQAKEQEKVLGKNKDFAYAIAKGIRIAPRKVRLVIDLIRGKNIKEAKAILMFTRRAASKPINDVLTSAIANAVNNCNLNEDKLYVSTCYVSEGMTLKRMLPRARGSADTIRKRTSQIRVEVKERN